MKLKNCIIAAGSYARNKSASVPTQESYGIYKKKNYTKKKKRKNIE